MDIKEGDLVITLPKIEKVRAIIDKLGKGQVGVITHISSQFDDKTVYGVMIEGETYFLFRDEIEKLEEEC
jgi:hypothetical protein